LLKQEEIDKIDTVFRTVDTEFNGKLTIKQLEKICTLDTQNTISLDHFKHVLNAADLDGSQTIDSAEFRAATMMISYPIEDS